MLAKSWTIVAIVAFIVLGVCVGGWQKANLPRGDSRARQIYEAVDPYRNQNDSQFWIRVTEHPETPSSTFIAGTFYSFDSGTTETGPWKSIMTVHLDDPDPIPSNQVLFVNDKIGYVYLYDKLAVTTDAGQSWSLWELAQAPAKWRPRRAIIRNVILRADGSGTMTVEAFASQEMVMLTTSDFGKSWLEQ